MQKAVTLQAEFPDAVKELRDPIVLATIDVYQTSMASLLPTPTKSHYLFNLRDIGRVMGGLLLLRPKALGSGAAAKAKFTRLWVHEILRVFYDRCFPLPLLCPPPLLLLLLFHPPFFFPQVELPSARMAHERTSERTRRLTDDEDRTWLVKYIKEVAQTRLGADVDALFKHLCSGSGGVGLEELRGIFFGDYLDTTAEEAAERAYDEAPVRLSPWPATDRFDESCPHVMLWCQRCRHVSMSCCGMDSVVHTSIAQLACSPRAQRRRWAIVYGPVALSPLELSYNGVKLSQSRRSEAVQDRTAVLAAMEEFLVDHNATSKRPMNLALFLYAMEHISRACRVLRQPGNHLLNVGVGGSGRQSLSRLAAFICGCEALQVEISKSYTQTEWREDLKRFTRRCVLPMRTT